MSNTKISDLKNKVPNWKCLDTIDYVEISVFLNKKY